MKVGLVIPGNLDFPSGGFLYDRQLVAALRRAGDEVDVISLPWDAYAVSIARNLDPRLHERLRSWRGDLLLQDELAHPSLLLVNRGFLWDRSIPTVSIVHHLRSSERRRAMSSAAARFAERAYLRSVDAFVFNGRATRQAVENLTGKASRCIVAPPAGDRLGCGATEEEAAARSSESGALRVLFVGNLIPRKGLLDLLGALAAIPRKEWSLTVAGSRDADPAHARQVERFVDRHGLRPNVVMRGHLGDAELAHQMRAAHVLAVPSEYEGFGIVYLEAMGFGVVPIGSSAGGAAVVIEKGRSGFLVRPGDPAALSRTLRHLAADRSALESLSLGALRRYRQFPGWEQRMAEVRSWLCALAGTWT
jgi:glycosyltransferase involved in cell wall biosynthesis